MTTIVERFGLFNLVVDQDPATRQTAAKRLRLFIETEAREMLSESRTKLLQELDANIRTLINSEVSFERLGGIALIKELLQMNVRGYSLKTSVFADYLQSLLPDEDVSVMQAAAKAMGELATSETISRQFAASKLNWAISQLREQPLRTPSPAQRHAAVLVLGEMSMADPPTAADGMGDLLPILWPALTDSREQTRTAAADALGVLLGILKQRDPRWSQRYVQVVYDQCRGLLGGRPAPPLAHGALLAVGRLLDVRCPLLEARFPSLCEAVSRHRRNRSSLVRQAVAKLLPPLARFDPERFTKGFLATTMEHLLGTLSTQSGGSAGLEERRELFVVLGEVSVAVGEDAIVTYFPSILNLVRDGLTPRSKSKSKKDKEFIPEAMQCVRLMSQAAPGLLQQHVEPLLDRMFAGGLSHSLVEALTELSTHLPMWLPDVQRRLLHAESYVLAGVPLFFANGAALPQRNSQAHTPMAFEGDAAGNPLTSGNPVTGLAGTLPTRGEHLLRRPIGFGSAASELPVLESATKFVQLPSPALREGGEEQVALALQTLCEFDFVQFSLTFFVADVVVRYLSHASGDVRLWAARACCKLLLPPRALQRQGQARGPNVGFSVSRDYSRGHNAILIADCLSQLVVVGVTDILPSVRLTVLQGLDGRFDPWLAQESNLRALFVAVNDESHQVRRAVITIIGRLSRLNPAFIMPQIRKNLVHLLTELEYSEEVPVRRHSAQLLGTLVSSCSFLIRPYVSAILTTLRTKLKDEESVATSVLVTLGELARVGGADVLPFMSELMPLIIRLLRDQGSPSKRVAALRTLGQLAQSTGYVVSPYRKYPELLELILSILKTEQHQHVRLEVVRVMGIFGAIDPAQVRPAGHAAQVRAETMKGSGHSTTTESGDHSILSADELPVSEELIWQENAVQNSPPPLLGHGPDALGPTAAALRPEGSTEQDLKTTDPEDGLSVDEHHGEELGNTRYYSRQVLHALMGILEQPSLDAFHSAAVHSLLSVFKTDGTNCLPFLKSLVPLLLRILRAAPLQTQEFLLRQLTVLVSLVGHHAQPYVADVLVLVRPMWESTRLVPLLLALVEELALSVQEELKHHLQHLIPRLLALLGGSSHSAQRCLSTLVVLAPNLEDYLHLVLPALVRMAQQQPLDSQLKALDAIGRLAMLLNLTDSSSMLVHPIVRIIGRRNEGGDALQLADQAMDTLCALVHQLGEDFALFVPLVNQALVKTGYTSELYERMVTHILRGTPMPARSTGSQSSSLLKYGENPKPLQPVGAQALLQENKVSETTETRQSFFSRSRPAAARPGLGDTLGIPEDVWGVGETDIVHCEMDLSSLQRAWRVRDCTTQADWRNWITRLSLELLRQSPQSSLRACAPLTRVYPRLSRQLLNTAFVSVWVALDPKEQSQVMDSLKVAFTSDTIPLEILQALLDLAEFLEQHDTRQQLPLFEATLLGSLAEKCHAYAKALRYKEMEYEVHPATAVEGLVSINNQLGQVEAAKGIILSAQRAAHGMSGLAGDVSDGEEGLPAFKMTAGWFEKLQRWDDALDAFSVQAEEEASEGAVEVSTADVLGRLRCLWALGRWEELLDVSEQYYPVKQPHSHDEGVSLLAGDLPEAAAICGYACMQLHSWDRLNHWMHLIPEDHVDGLFLRAVNSVVHNHFDDAIAHIEQARALIDPRLVALVSESYQRAYKSATAVQRLVELEEVAHYLRDCGGSAPAQLAADRLQHLRAMWSRRLAGVSHDVDTWADLLAVRRLVLDPRSDSGVWIRFADMCQHNKRHALARRTLLGLLGISNRLVEPILTLRSNGPCEPALVVETSDDETVGICIRGQEHVAPSPLSWLSGIPPLPHDQPRVVYSLIKHCWRQADTRMGRLQAFTQLLRVTNDPVVRNLNPSLASHALVRLAAWYSSLVLPRAGEASRVIYTGGTLAGELEGAGGDGPTADLAVAAAAEEAVMALTSQTKLWPGQRALLWFEQSTQLDEGWARGWRCLGHTASRLVEMTETRIKEEEGSEEEMELEQESTQVEILRQLCARYLVTAISSHFRCIATGPGSDLLPATLRLLTLWFTHGSLPAVETEMIRGFALVSVDVWLYVIPQIIARLHSKSTRVRMLVHQLLVAVGNSHPQALVYPLTVAAKTSASNRQADALAILDRMRRRNPQNAELVDQALLVSGELIRVAILWPEMWHEAIGLAATCYFDEKNVERMFQVLAPLHLQLDRGPETLAERAFTQAFSGHLLEAHGKCRKYPQQRDMTTLNEAWRLYFDVYQAIQEQIPQLSTLELQYVSPKLQAARALALSVPGGYHPDRPVVRIHAFAPRLTVISSQQRPRKLSIVGSDGDCYVYLLKGHEDIRQDERVMQLFGLINTLLTADPEVGRKDLTIVRYPAIPLSPNSGLLCWVPFTDTMLELIKGYRTARNIMINIEFHLMCQHAPHFKHVTLVQKIEAFRHALSNTTGQDLQKVLWLKSTSSERWLSRRTNYTRSIAVMSMAGYILGLGDRHPANLMIDRKSGTVVHIDYGETFETANRRAKFPERVPFRLTRMMVTAMEAAGIEGNFRMTCEGTMRVLRENKDSVMAILEAFVYDPLISWRIIRPGGKGPGGVNVDDDQPWAGGSGPKAGDVPTSERWSGEGETSSENKEERNPRAMRIVKRVESKLIGLDFPRLTRRLDVAAQVDRLIRSAQNHENLCQSYMGWCPQW